MHERGWSERIYHRQGWTTDEEAHISMPDLRFFADLKE